MKTSILVLTIFAFPGGFSGCATNPQTWDRDRLNHPAMDLSIPHVLSRDALRSPLGDPSFVTGGGACVTCAH